MSKKPPSKSCNVVPIKPVNESNKVYSLIGKLEKRTEKQMANFVKEIVKIKKEQNKMKEKLKEKKKIISKKSKVKNPANKSKKKRKKRQLTLVKDNTD